jgi:uncharacterized short protein YbdD (DUF466 family)
MRQSATALGTGVSAAGPGGVRRIAGVVRAVVGAPDYDRYVAHMRAHHPECELASRDEFMRQRLESRYSRPGARCC